MNMRVRYSVGDVHIGLSFGGLQWITEHTGITDQVSYIDVRFEHGLLQMTAEALATLIRRGQETLASLPPQPGGS